MTTRCEPVAEGSPMDGGRGVMSIAKTSRKLVIASDTNLFLSK